MLGNEGDDWIETGTFDGAPGDNFDEIFARDGVNGHDVFLGDGGFDEFIGEGGDDIMVGSLGRGKMAGMSGFDWATYKDNTFGVDADLTRGIVFDEIPTPPQNGTLDAYESVEGLSGSRFNDVLTGSDTLAAERLPSARAAPKAIRGSALDAEGIALIAGLQAVLGAGVTAYSRRRHHPRRRRQRHDRGPRRRRHHRRRQVAERADRCLASTTRTAHRHADRAAQQHDDAGRRMFAGHDQSRPARDRPRRS